VRPDHPFDRCSKRIAKVCKQSYVGPAYGEARGGRFGKHHSLSFIEGRVEKEVRTGKVTMQVFVGDKTLERHLREIPSSPAAAAVSRSSCPGR